MIILLEIEYIVIKKILSILWKMQDWMLVLKGRVICSLGYALAMFKTKLVMLLASMKKV
jgi:hypothetical protein